MLLSPTVQMTTDASGSHSKLLPQSKCQIVTPSNTDAWEKAIDAMDPSSRFLCANWTKILQVTYGYEPHLIILEVNGAIVGVLPYVVVKSIFTGTRAISLPFFDICRVYAKDTQVIRNLYEAFKAEGKRKAWDYIEMRGDIEQLGLPPSLRFYNHVVDLSEGPDSVFENLHPSVRRAIRKAEKSQVQIEFSNSLSSIKDFYRLQCITRKRHGLPPQPYSFFRNLYQELISTENGMVVSASVEGRLAAASVYLKQGNTAHYKYGASDTRFQASRCNNYVMWAAMKYFSENGVGQMDLGRNSLENQGLRRYKRSWGSKEYITSYLRLDLRTDKTIPMSDDVYGWHNRLFHNLPLSLNKIIGKLLYKHIA